nr:TrbI/VirB10 family protein [Acetobacter persici]
MTWCGSSARTALRGGTDDEPGRNSRPCHAFIGQGGARGGGAARSAAPGQEITRRNMNIQPTLTTRPGLPVRIIVNRDLVLRPYQPMFFQRGAMQ